MPRRAPTHAQRLKERRKGTPDHADRIRRRDDEQVRAFYSSARWQRVAAQAKRRDKGLCQPCKRRGRVTAFTMSRPREGEPKRIPLQVHHKRPLRTHWQLRCFMGNLETICSTCHSKENQRERKA